jgi:hypothetical protein
VQCHYPCQFANCHYADYHNAKCHFSEHQYEKHCYSGCLYDESHYVSIVHHGCRSAVCHYAECRGAKPKTFQDGQKQRHKFETFVSVCVVVVGWGGVQEYTLGAIS